MTNDEYMITYRRTWEGLNPGDAALRQRLIPGMVVLGHAALACLIDTDSWAARVRAFSAADLRRILAKPAPRFDELRDGLAVLCWHELACRGESYKPRGVVEVAHAWAWLMCEIQ